VRISSSAIEKILHSLFIIANPRAMFEKQPIKHAVRVLPFILVLQWSWELHAAKTKYCMQNEKY